MTGKELLKYAKQKGYVLIRIEGSHHILRRDKSTIVIPVHGNKDIPKGLAMKLMNMINQGGKL